MGYKIGLDWFLCRNRPRVGANRLGRRGTQARQVFSVDPVILGRCPVGLRESAWTRRTEQRLRECDRTLDVRCVHSFVIFQRLVELMHTVHQPGPSHRTGAFLLTEGPWNR